MHIIVLHHVCSRWSVTFLSSFLHTTHRLLLLSHRWEGFFFPVFPVLSVDITRLPFSTSFLCVTPLHGLHVHPSSDPSCAAFYSIIVFFPSFSSTWAEEAGRGFRWCRCMGSSLFVACEWQYLASVCMLSMCPLPDNRLNGPALVDLHSFVFDRGTFFSASSLQFFFLVWHTRCSYTRSYYQRLMLPCHFIGPSFFFFSSSHSLGFSYLQETIIK